MLRSYDPLLVVASLVVATLASYAALDLSGRVARAAGTARAVWLAAGAVALGAGIWGMHFVGMLAFRLADAGGRPIPIAYHLPGVALSVAIAVGASAVALAVAAREAVGRAAFATAGLVMGVAIAGMHYVGVAAMRLPGHAAMHAAGGTEPITYRPALVALAYGIAVGASLVALMLARRVRQPAGTPGAGEADARRVTVGARALALPALVMGAAIAGMHYVGMASAAFHVMPAADGASFDLPHDLAQLDAVVATPTLALAVTVGVFLVLAVVLAVGTAGRWSGATRTAADAETPSAFGAVAGLRSGPARFERDVRGGPSLRLKLTAAAGAGVLVLGIGLAAYAGLWQYRRAADWVEHTRDVQRALARVPAGVGEAEAAARGYILTGYPAFERSYDQAAARARQAAADARTLTADNPEQRRRLAALPGLLDRRLDVLTAGIGRRRASGRAAADSMIATAGGATGGGRGPALSDSIAALIAAADQAEARLLDARGALLTRRGRLLDVVLLGGSLAAFTLILLVTQAIRRDVALREAAQRRVEEQAAELGAQAEQLEQQQVQLEERLEEEQALTEELTEANGQLAAAEAVQARLLADARLEESRYRALVEAGAQMVWTTTPDGELAGEQPGWAAFTGQTRAEYEGWGWVEAIHPDDRPHTEAGWEAAVAAGERYTVEHRVLRRDGVYRRMQARAVPVPDEHGRIREFVGVHTDVTAERAAQAQREGLIRALERSNRDLDQFAYVASHDLKAPLRGISNLSSWIEEDLAAVMTPEAREQMVLLRGRVQRMEGLIDGVLQYSRAGRTRAAAEAVDTGALAREAAELLAPGPRAMIRVADGMPVVTAERVPLQQIFLNLIGNGLKYAGREDAVVAVSAAPAGGPDGAPPRHTPARGSGVVPSRSNGIGFDPRADRPAGAPADPPERPAEARWYTFTVADNGPGIAPQYHERVFGLFQTLQSRDRVEGTGIGLSVVKKIVEAQGGRAWVESAEGEGARFRFTWPAAPQSADALRGDPDDAVPAVAVA